MQTYTDFPSSTPPQNSTRLLQDSIPSSSLPTSSPGRVYSDLSPSPTTAVAVLVTTAASVGVVLSSAAVGVAIVVVVVGVASPRNFSS